MKTRTSLHIQMRVVAVVLAAISLNCARIKTTVVQDERLVRREEVPLRVDTREVRVAVEGGENDLLIRLTAQNQCGVKLQDVHERFEAENREALLDLKRGTTIPALPVYIAGALVGFGFGEGMSRAIFTEESPGDQSGAGAGRAFFRVSWDLIGGAFALLAIIDGVRQIDSERSLGTYTTEVSRHTEPCEIRPLAQTAVTLAFPQSPDISLKTLNDGSVSTTGARLTTDTLTLERLQGTGRVGPGQQSFSVEVPEPVLLALRTARAESLLEEGLERVKAGRLSDARATLQQVEALGGDPTRLSKALLAAEEQRAASLVAEAREQIEAGRFDNVWKKLLDAEKLGHDVAGLRGELAAAKLRGGEAKVRDSLVLIRQGKLDEAARAVEEAEALNVDTNAARTLIAEVEWKRSGRSMDLDTLRAFARRHDVATPDDARRRLEVLEARAVEAERRRREDEERRARAERVATRRKVCSAIRRHATAPEREALLALAYIFGGQIDPYQRAANALVADSVSETVAQQSALARLDARTVVAVGSNGPLPPLTITYLHALGIEEGKQIETIKRVRDGVFASLLHRVNGVDFRGVDESSIDEYLTTSEEQFLRYSAHVATALNIAPATLSTAIRLAYCPR